MKKNEHGNKVKSVAYATENDRAKYGAEDDDVIARAFREGREIGNVWCVKNIEKYGRRFIGKSVKANNYIDLLKMRTYLDRLIEANEDLRETSKDIKES